MDQQNQQLPQSLREIISVVHDVSAKAQYPIGNFGQLAQALGGDKGSVTLLGETYKVSELRNIVPPEYFPIESEEDLVMKVTSGYVSRPGASMDFARGQKLDAPPAGHQQPGAPPADHPKLKGLPMLKGRKRQ